MAKISYTRGIKCKRCGKLYVTLNKYLRCFLCQNCGAYLGNFDIEANCLTVEENGEIVTIKVTHKLFSETYEEVE